MADTRSTTTDSSTPAKKSTAKTSTAKTSTTKTTAKTTAKKTTAKRTSATRTPSKKTSKRAASTSTAKKSTAKRAPAKKSTTKTATARRPSAKKSAKKTAKKTARRASRTPSSSLAVKGLESTRAAAGAAVVRAAAVTQTPVEAGKALVERAGERVADMSRAVAAPSSTFFARVPVRARALAADRESLRGLADKVLHSASGRSGPVSEVTDEFKTLGRLVAAYARGDYRDIPLDSLIMVVAGLVYVASPIDLVPDSLPVAGYADDAVAVGFVIRQVHHELAAFRAWEVERSSKG